MHLHLVQVAREADDVAILPLDALVFARFALVVGELVLAVDRPRVAVSVARRVRRSLPLRNLVVSDEVGGVGLVTVLDHKDGRVLHPVDQRVVPSVTLVRQKGTNLHTLRTLCRQASKNIYQHHLLVPRCQGPRIVIAVPCVSGKIGAIAPRWPQSTSRRASEKSRGRSRSSQLPPLR